MLKMEAESENNLRVKAEKVCLQYRSMSRSYWERWQWELQERRELIASQQNECLYHLRLEVYLM